MGLLQKATFGLRICLKGRSKPDRVQNSEFTKYRKFRGVDFFVSDTRHEIEIVSQRTPLLNSRHVLDLQNGFF